MQRYILLEKARTLLETAVELLSKVLVEWMDWIPLIDNYDY